MWQKEKKYSSIVSLAFLLTLASQPLVTTFFFSPLVVAQSPSSEPSFPLPKTVPTGTNLNIDGSSSMVRINNNLKQKYEQQYPGTKVNLTTNGTNAALKALIDGKNVDLAAIGRGLTPQEQSKGLEQFRLRREKIGIVVGEKNPFKGNLTNQQFAKIFRGEITDWSQLGGAKGKIRFIDRPNDSDTREALRNYPSFQSAKFATGANATQLKQDDTALLVKELGKDGIGYAIANQISQVPGLRVLKLHQTLPDNPKYPFSQPLVYVFKKNPTASVASFLGFAGAEPGKIAVEAARTAEASAVAQTVAQAPATTATPGATTSPGNTETTTTSTTSTTVTSPDTGTATNTSTGTNSGNQAFVQGGSETAANGGETTPFPLWWLALPVAALGLLWWLIGGKGKKEKEKEPVIAPATTLPIDQTTNTVLPVSDGELTGSTPDLSGAVLASTAAIAGGAAGVSLWSRLGNSVDEDVTDTNTAEISSEISSDLEEPAAVVMPYTGLTGMPQADSVESALAELPVGIADIPDVEIPTVDELPPGQGNLLDNLDLTSVGGATLAAGAGAGLLSRFGNTGDEATNQNQQIQDTLQAEATPPKTTHYVSEVLPDAWDDTQVHPNVNSNEIIVEDEQLPTISETSQSNVVPDANLLAVDEPQTEPTWLDNITSTDNTTNTTIAGVAGVAGVAGAGAALWSQFANRDGEQNNPEIPTNTEVDDSTNTRLDLNTVADAAELSQDVVPSETEVSNISAVSEIQDTKVEDSTADEDLNPIALAGAAAVTAGAGAALLSNFSNYQQTPTVVQVSDNVQNHQPYSQNANIILTPRTPKWAYASWYVSNVEKEMLRQQGGSQMALRLYDVTGIDLSYQEPQLIQQHECQEVTEDRFVAIPVSDRDYMIELGYLTDDNRWLSLTRSSIVRVFSRPHDEFWFETDAELIIHGATKPGSNISIAGHPIKLKSDGTFHLRVPFTEELLDYVMKAVAVDGDKDKTIHVRFSQNESQK